MVYRIYVEKKPELANEAAGIYSDLSLLLGIEGLKGVRLLNRYDVENVSEELFRAITGTVLSEPQLDIVTESIPEGDFAARLIDASGLKGLTVGGAQVSEKHAGFIVNRGGATASDVLGLMARVRDEVYSRHGVLLESEIEYVE